MGELRFTRATQGLHGKGQLAVWTPLECVRCLGEYEHPLSLEVNDLFTYPASEAADPLLAIPETAILDLRPLVREFALVAIPIRPLCRLDCKGLCPECGVDRNQTDCGHRFEPSDTRLAALEGLRDSL